MGEEQVVMAPADSPTAPPSSTDPELAMAGTAASSPASSSASVQRVRDLLRTRDDTSRFVGLALLKSLLDNSTELRDDKGTISSLWDCISPKFLDRLLRSGHPASGMEAGAGGGEDGGKAQQQEGKNLLDLAVAVLHTFTALLPDQVKREPKLVGRIPTLTASILHSSKETTTLSLETLSVLVDSLEGARAFTKIEDLSPLTEIAPSEPLVLKILALAWLNAMAVPELIRGPHLRSKIDETIQAMVSSFPDTEAVTLLPFLADLLRNLDPELLSPSPRWLPNVVSFIRTLVRSRPTAAGRTAYTTLCATLLQVYPLSAPTLIFSSSSSTISSPPTATTASTTGPSSATPREDNADQRPFSYLLTTLLLIDIRYSLPSLLAHLNTPSVYGPTSARLAAAFDVLSFFIGYLVRSVDAIEVDTGPEPLGLLMPSDLLLKLRKSMAETVSITIEHLRDRYDAATAGALGLHPDAITDTVPGGASRPRPLTWEGASVRTGEDPLVLAAVRTMALWLREDDNDALRAEAAGLCDMLIDLYRDSGKAATSAGPEDNDDKDNGDDSSSSRESQNPQRHPQHLDFRRPILVALEGITACDEGIEAFLDPPTSTSSSSSLSQPLTGWDVLAADMLAILRSTSAPSPPLKQRQGGSPSTTESAARGTEIIRVLLPLVEAEQPGTRESWMPVVTAIASWDVTDPDDDSAAAGAKPTPSSLLPIAEFQIAALQLTTALLAAAHPGMCRRYARSTSAVLDTARRLMRRLPETGEAGGGGDTPDVDGLRESLQDVIDTLGGMVP